MTKKKNKKLFYSSKKGIVIYFSKGRTGNILTESAILSKIYPNKKILLLTKSNNLLKFKENITTIKLKDNYFTRISILSIQKILFYLTKLKLISFLFEYGEKEYMTDIKETKGLFNFITLANYISFFQIPKYLNNVSIPFDINYHQKNYLKKLKHLN